MNHPQTILTGDRPTGQLHLGHYVGSLRQRVALQHNHQQFILIADLQGLTDNGSNPQKISHHILEVMADYLAVGIDPRLTTICLQSALPALAELSALYMNIVTVARVERNPTVKNEIAQKGFARSLPVGFLAYPISQAADITAFKAELVPVGDDARNNPAKYREMFQRRAEKGQCVNQPYLGCREFAARFRLVDQPEDGAPAIDETRDLGWMLFDMDFTAVGDPKPQFFRADMQHGVIDLTKAQVMG